MMQRLILFLGILGMVTTSPEVSAQTQQPFPHGKDWMGTDYGQSDLWFSTSLVASHRRSPDTPHLQPKNMIIYGIEGRLHLHPKLSIMTGFHWGGYEKLAYEYDAIPAGTALAYSSEVKQQYDSFIFQLGVDFGLLESTHFHIQAGPRIGTDKRSTELVGNSDVIATLDNIKEEGTAFHVGGVVAIGGFVAPFIEIGLRGQTDYSIGGLKPGMGHQGGMYTTTHF
tara:strand:+ start:539 stop:1213 length:675 start_codon:yes stop_codon:yes gene_type:complete